MEFQFIDKVGVEIEGGWASWNHIDYNLSSDMSIKAAAFTPEVKALGELISQPFSTMDELFVFMDKFWPIEGPECCGFHVHFSLKNINSYITCMDKKFYDEFIAKIIQWGNEYPCKNKLFWGRLENKNRFTRNVFNADKQVFLKQKQEDRYSHLNFCYSLHKTIECRLFPTFSEPETAKSAVIALLTHVEDYLKKNPPNEVLSNSEEILDENLEKIKVIKFGGFNLFKVTKGFKEYTNDSSEVVF